MSQGLPWGDSPIDLSEEEPGEVKFLTPEAAEELDTADDALSDMGPHERTAAWEVPGIKAGLGWVSGAVAVSTLALLGLNSHALANWADQLPVMSVTAPVVSAADGWHDAAGQLGLNTVVDSVEGAAKAMRKATWPGQKPSTDGEGGGADAPT
ncbi:hypothetical protein [Novosphingobium rosa]|uniref:hypothetical protein n=1 Tax=Novosphingobium rosa TaxID=76978 RepID=UPI000B03EBD8|nr:hypothetical protein [Novosphingobium rosa]